jgi:urease accessory protein
MTQMSVLTRAEPALPVSPSRLQRVNGKAMVRFGPHGIRDLEQAAPARLLFPRGADPKFTLAVTVTTTGGLTGGDRMSLDIVVDPGACATIVPQAAEKLYRALPGEAATYIETRIALAPASCCEWIAHEAILFDRSRLRRTLRIDLADDARVLAMEMLVFGRGAMGETFNEGFVHDAWSIRRDGRLIWADALHLEGDFRAAADSRFGFDGATATLTLVHAGPDAEVHLELARSLAGAQGGATAFDGLLILRLAGADSHEVRKSGLRATEALRQAIFGLSPALPSLCYC